MYESGYYPAGAEFDPRAPWNEREPTMVECAACGGKGYHWYAYDFEADYDRMFRRNMEYASRNGRRGYCKTNALNQGRKGGVRW